jgi:hypothetical protein
MFRLGYSPSSDEAPHDLSSTAGFDVVETTSPSAGGGYRGTPDLAACAAALAGGAVYAIWRPSVTWREATRMIDDLDWPRTGEGALLIEPWRECATPRELWHLVESISNEAARRRVRIAWSAVDPLTRDVAPAAVVPVLNLKLGLVRVADGSARTMEYAKRLAGIGFGGWMIVDPPTESADAHPTRRDAAIAIAQGIRTLLAPPKPARPTPIKKPA